MLVFLAFIKKEWSEVKQYRKLWILLLICLFLPFVSNYLANNPLLPMTVLAPLYIVISACIVGEFIKASLVEEISMSTLDNILISPFKNGFLIFYKTVIPILISYTVTILGMIISDIALISVPSFSHFIVMTSPLNILVALISCIICAWVSFYLLVSSRKTSPNLFTLILGLIMVIIGILAIISSLYHPAIIVAFSLIALPVIYTACSITLTSPQPPKKIISRQWICLFKGQNLHFTTAIIVKDLTCIRLLHILEILMFVTLISISNNINLFFFLLFLLTTYGARKLLYQNTVEEKLAKTYDILQIQKSKRFIFCAHAIVPTCISLVASLIAIANSSYFVKNAIVVIFIVILSPVFTYAITKTINRRKEVSYGSISLCAVLMVLFTAVYSIVL
ncbi:hypothetical protein RFF05_14100 [Bengtsoniella intestinalis]|uniref:hypothetical protein n=1 Tax=Bengtsoniella intestinalis TaxID=3073143 RepID=UPI00391EEA7E